MATPNRKVLIAELGDVSKVNVVDSFIDPPTEDEVQIAILYSGFSGADVNMRRGLYPMQKAVPLTPGYVLVGKVNIVGPRSNFKPGDLVTALTVYDSEAELINVSEKYLNRVPTGLGPKQAVALTLDWNTAYGIVEAAKVSHGQKVFVHGLSGAVGNGIMKLSQLRGAEVFGTASVRNHAAIEAQGGHPFVYTNKDWMQKMIEAGGVDAVFDPLGFESWDESYSILASSRSSVLAGYGGNLSSLTGTPARGFVWPTIRLLLQNLKFWSFKRTIFHYITRDQSSFKPNLQILFDLCQQGKIEVSIKQVFKMDDIRDAHRAWVSGGMGVGSTLIEI
ncbi:hypothetical protein AMS68_005077 [Peltaster fructicola]|uniref:Enoyl reductase (ER) domain-containing protein n=1 Tax=Peltaster fructicola TaxID=286661 RepID=A0A6H0XYR6_9PEZI|nr:hypothetical protein AMS68_005077 [Peltaster fructicola]